jgi:hypothetical protein
MDQPDLTPHIRIEERCPFTREQLLEEDYDPIAEGLVDLAYLQRRYRHHLHYDHAAAVRAILVRPGKRDWKWIWGIGLLHDHILAETGYPKLYARYRNQRGMLPRIEFHAGADLYVSLQLLLETTPLRPEDAINIVSEMGGRWMSIGDYFGEDPAHQIDH